MKVTLNVKCLLILISLSSTWTIGTSFHQNCLFSTQFIFVMINWCSFNASMIFHPLLNLPILMSILFTFFRSLRIVSIWNIIYIHYSVMICWSTFKNNEQSRFMAIIYKQTSYLSIFILFCSKSFFRFWGLWDKKGSMCRHQ